MGKKRIAAIKDMGDSVDLMGSKCDFWADTSESDMASVILTGSHKCRCNNGQGGFAVLGLSISNPETPA